MPLTPVAPSGRPTRDAAELLLGRILAAARAEFIARGIEGASMEGIAAVAGCSKLTLYRRFGSKRELFMALMKARTPEYEKKFLIDMSLPTDQVLYQLGMHIAAFFFKPDHLKLLRLVVSEMSRVEGLPELMREEGDRFRKPVIACLEALKRRGGGTFNDSRLAAIQFTNLCGLGHYYLLAGYTAEDVSQTEQETLVRSAVELFVATHFAQASQAKTI
jgi:TetR/AcrR family transcriptional repressor of mexJK operon